MPKPEPLKPTSIKFSKGERRFIEKTAEAQGHYNKSLVIRRLVQREMKA